MQVKNYWTISFGLLFLVAFYLFLPVLSPYISFAEKLYLTLLIGFISLTIFAFRKLLRKEHLFNNKYRKILLSNKVLLDRLSEMDYEPLTLLLKEYEPIRSADLNKINYEDADEIIEEINISTFLKKKLMSKISVATDLTTQERSNQNRTASPSDPSKAASSADGKNKLPMLPIDQEVRLSIHQNKIEVYLQPLVRLPSRQKVGYELFSRLIASNGDIISGKDYLPVATEQKIISELDNYLLFRCIQLLRNKKIPQTLVFFTNISHNSLLNTDFITQLIDFIAANKETGKRLMFDLVQKDLELLSNKLMPLLKKMAALNVQFCLDNAQIRRLPLHLFSQIPITHIKVDVKQLVEFATSPEMKRTWQDIRAGILRHEVKIIASQVETEEQVLCVLDLGIEFGQGYIFGEPSLNYRIA